jgi:PAS domain S-box-containing protein
MSLAGPTSFGFLDGGGKMGALMRAHDWSRSPLGPPMGWPDALKAAVATCLASRFPMVVWWGPDLIMLYNDAWQPILGVTKHPAGLGRPGAESWPETWPIVRQQFEDALRGNASWSENLLLASDRRGFLEECYFTYSHSPLRDAEGKVVGVQTAVIETTDRVLGERRMLILRDLSKATVEATTQGASIERTCEALLDLLCKGNPDIPFAAQYISEDRLRARLICCRGIDESLLPPTVNAVDRDPWGIAEALRKRAPAFSERPQSTSKPLPGGAWPEPTRQMVALPLARKARASDLLGVILVGVNSRLSLDEPYMDFLNLVAAELAGSIATIHAVKKEMEDLAALRKAEVALRTSEAQLAQEAVALQRLHDSSSRLWQIRDLRKGLAEMLRASLHMLGADKGYVQIMNPRGVLTIAAHQGFDHSFLEFFKEASVEDSSADGKALRAGRRIIVEDVEADQGSAPFRPIALAAGYRAVQSTPLIARDGRPLGMLSTHFRNPHRPSEHELRILDLYARQAADFIERIRSDEALRQSEERYKGIYENAGTGIYSVDLAGRFQYCNPAYATMHGYTEEELRKLSLREVVHPEDWPRHTPEIQLLAAGKIPSFEIMNRCVAKGGELLWVHKHVSLLRDAAGRPESIIALVTDVTERKNNEECIALLMREVNHRSKNLLALVQAIARQTNAPEDFLNHFDERLQALAAGDDLLVKNDWKGVDFMELARSQLAHVIDPVDARIELSGPPILVSASTAQTLGMALHELATNAGKYGALSNHTGRVELAWNVKDGTSADGVFTINWRESGGPPVTEPSRSGFGSSVICNMVEYNLNAEVRLNFFAAGLEWRLQCPLAAVVGSKRSSRSTTPTLGRDGETRGGPARVLVVENEGLVADEISRILGDAGFQVVGPAGRVENAFRLLNDVGCDAAVLDMQLGGETSELIARVLAARGTPFVTLSGYHQDQRPGGVEEATFLTKPLRSELLIEQVRRCIDRRAGRLNAHSARS